MSSIYRIREPVPNSIVILRALQLGDLLCSVPAFRALRASIPNAQISLIGLPWARNFVSRFHTYLDKFIEFPGFPGFPETTPDIKRIPQFLEAMQVNHFDLSIQMQGSGNISNSLASIFAARNQAGYYLPGQYCPDINRFFPYPVHENEVLRHLHLMEFLGIPTKGTHLEFPISDEERRQGNMLLHTYDLHPGEYIVMHPGARAPERRWPTGRFADVGIKLVEQGIKVVLTGSQEEERITQDVNSRMGFTAIDLGGKTDLGVLACILQEARLLICNDTGVSHIAAALNLPSIVLFMTSDPKRWAPLDQQLHRIVAWASTASPQVVLVNIEEMLQEERNYAS